MATPASSRASARSTSRCSVVSSSAGGVAVLLAHCSGGTAEDAVRIIEVDHPRGLDVEEGVSKLSDLLCGPAVGSCWQIACRTSRRSKVEACAVSPSGPSRRRARAARLTRRSGRGRSTRAVISCEPKPSSAARCSHRRDSRSTSRSRSLDLRPTLRELLDDLAGVAHQVGVAIDHRPPLHPQPARQLVPQLRLVQQPSGLGVPVQPPRIQRPPPAVVDRLHAVRNQHVRIQQRIVRP